MIVCFCVFVWFISFPNARVLSLSLTHTHTHTDTHSLTRTQTLPTVLARVRRTAVVLAHPCSLSLSFTSVKFYVRRYLFEGLVHSHSLSYGLPSLSLSLSRFERFLLLLSLSLVLQLLALLFSFFVCRVRKANATYLCL